MILESRGEIAGDLFAIGNADWPAFLWRGRVPVLFDAGITFMGPTYYHDLEIHLGEAQRLRYLLLTHSHYDHCGSAPYLKRKIPSLMIGASVAAAEIFQRPNAILLIQHLSREAEGDFGSLIGGEDVSFEKIGVDFPLADGAGIDVGEEGEIQVVATPGHTRDGLSFYLPWIKTLICGEAVGTLNRDGSIRSQFLASDQDYIDSLRKLLRLEIDTLIMAHFHVLVGNDARRHLEQSIEATVALQKRIEKELTAHTGNQQAVVAKIHREDYREKKIILQEEKPYLINLAAQVKTVAEGKPSRP